MQFIKILLPPSLELDNVVYCGTYHALVFQSITFNIILTASTFAAAPTQLPPGYAYFYGGMAPQLQAAYGQTGVYPTPHPGIVPTAAGGTATTQFQKQYPSR